jgi:hypothetical protein
MGHYIVVISGCHAKSFWSLVAGYWLLAAGSKVSAAKI